MSISAEMNDKLQMLKEMSEQLGGAFDIDPEVLETIRHEAELHDLQNKLPKQDRNFMSVVATAVGSYVDDMEGNGPEQHAFKALVAGLGRLNIRLYQEKTELFNALKELNLRVELLEDAAKGD